MTATLLYPIVLFISILIDASLAQAWSGRECPSSLGELQKCKCEYSLNGNSNDIFGINCTNTKFQGTDVLKIANFPDNLVELYFTGNTFDNLSANLLGNCSHGLTQSKYRNLKVLDLSNNGITFIDGKAFHCMPNLETLVLDNNEWEVDPGLYGRIFSNLLELKNLSLKNALVSNADPVARTEQLGRLARIFRGSLVPHLEKLHLEDNELVSFSVEDFCNVSSLKELHLTNNKIVKPIFNSECMPSLDYIFLDNNLIQHIDLTTLREIEHHGELKGIYLQDNPYVCDCNMVSMATWLNNTKVPVHRIASLMCDSPNDLKGKALVDLDPKELVCKSNSRTVEFVFLGLAVVFFCSTAAAFIYIKRNKIFEVFYNYRTQKGYTTVSERVQNQTV